MATLLLTGATGFIGRRVLEAWQADRRRWPRLVVLSRQAPPPGIAEAGIAWRRGDLASPAAWTDVLGPATAVLHLAAATGAASPATLAAVNVDGTAALLRAAADRGCARFLFVSSIAAGWPDDPWYPYARTKRAAEQLVCGSGLANWTIARPTIVLGAGSPLWSRLRALATAGVLIGSGSARIQPILADDLARLLLDLLGREDLHGQTVDLGGPETVTMAEFLARVRRRELPDKPARWVRLPHGALRGGLVAAATVLRGRTPVSPGQLNSFVRDGVAAPHPATAAWQPRLAALDAQIAASGGS